MVVTATEFKANFGKYLELILSALQFICLAIYPPCNSFALQFYPPCTTGITALPPNIFSSFHLFLFPHNAFPNFQAPEATWAIIIRTAPAKMKISPKLKITFFSRPTLILK